MSLLSPQKSLRRNSSKSSRSSHSSSHRSSESQQHRKSGSGNLGSELNSYHTGHGQDIADLEVAIFQGDLYENPISNLYHYLWTKTEELRTCPNVMVPDTVVIKYASISAWYFTSVKDGQIKKKNSINCTKENIFVKFTKNSKSSADIVAYFITNGVDDDGDDTSTIEYMDELLLKHFLWGREWPENGILQMFQKPKGGQNSMLRAAWSPLLCIVERRVNNKRLDDKRTTLYDKAVTFDGPDYLSTTTPLSGSSLSSHIRRICISIADHIENTSPQQYKVKSMVLNLRVDPDDHIWLLWCSALRVDSSAGMASILTETDGSSSSMQGRSVGVSMTVSRGTEQSFHCPSCYRLRPMHEQYDVSYKMILTQHHNQQAMKSYLPNNANRLRLFPGFAKKKQLDEEEFVKWQEERIAEYQEREAAKKSKRRFGNSTFSSSIGSSNKSSKNGGSGGRHNKSKSSSKRVSRYDYESDEDEDDFNWENKDAIPPVIRTLHPSMSVSRFENLASNPQFLYTTTKVCEDCTLVFNESAFLNLQTNEKQLKKAQSDLKKHAEESAVVPAAAYATLKHQRTQGSTKRRTKSRTASRHGNAGNSSTGYHHSDDVYEPSYDRSTYRSTRQQNEKNMRSNNKHASSLTADAIARQQGDLSDSEYSSEEDYDHRDYYDDSTQPIHHSDTISTSSSRRRHARVGQSSASQEEVEYELRADEDEDDTVTDDIVLMDDELGESSSSALVDNEQSKKKTTKKGKKTKKGKTKTKRKTGLRKPANKNRRSTGIRGTSSSTKQSTKKQTGDDVYGSSALDLL